MKHLGAVDPLDHVIRPGVLERRTGNLDQLPVNADDEVSVQDEIVVQLPKSCVEKRWKYYNGD